MNESKMPVHLADVQKIDGFCRHLVSEFAPDNRDDVSEFFAQSDSSTAANMSNFQKL